MFQQITIVGNLGRDPEMFYTNSGKAYTRFSVAATETWNDAHNQKQEKTVWFRVTAWERTAENVAKYLTKGSKVMIVGTLEEPYAYINKETGQPAASLQVRPQTVKFLGGGTNQRPAPVATEEELAPDLVAPWQ